MTTGSAELMRCPYCAESIQPEAVLCRYCGRSVPSLCAALNHVGHRYGVGRAMDGSYALWDLHRGGKPVGTYPPTPEGWNWAWHDFTGWDAYALRTGRLTDAVRRSSSRVWIMPVALVLVLIVALVIVHAVRYQHCLVQPGLFSWPSVCV